MNSRHLSTISTSTTLHDHVLAHSHPPFLLLIILLTNSMLCVQHIRSAVTSTERLAQRLEFQTTIDSLTMLSAPLDHVPGSCGSRRVGQCYQLNVEPTELCLTGIRRTKRSDVAVRTNSTPFSSSHCNTRRLYHRPCTRQAFSPNGGVSPSELEHSGAPPKVRRDQPYRTHLYCQSPSRNRRHWLHPSLTCQAGLRMRGL